MEVRLRIWNVARLTWWTMFNHHQEAKWNGKHCMLGEGSSDTKQDDCVCQFATLTVWADIIQTSLWLRRCRRHNLWAASFTAWWEVQVHLHRGVLFGSHQKKKTEMILMKLGGMMEHEPRTNLLYLNLGWKHWRCFLLFLFTGKKFTCWTESIQQNWQMWMSVEICDKPSWIQVNCV